MCWINHDFSQRGASSAVAKASAKVAGFPAIAYFESFEQAPSVMSTVLSNDRYFVRIQYVIGDGGAAMDTYLHMLDSFSLGSEILKDSFQFPFDVKDKASLSLTATDTCCGYTSVGNPFPCDNGNCTWWAYYEQGYVPFYGNATQWWGEVPQFADWGRSTSTPHVDGLAWWNSTSRPPYGHVAQVLSLVGSDRIHVSEMTWQGTPCSQEPAYRDYAKTNPNGYIWYRWSGLPVRTR